MEHLLRSIVRLHAYTTPKQFAQPYRELERVAGVGSGTFVKGVGSNVDPNYLYILTCAHVVEDADQVTVVLPLKGSEQLPASVVSFVPKHNYDLAIVALHNPNGIYNSYIRYLPLGSSDKLVQGQKLLALGFPMGQTGLKVSDGVFAGVQHFLQHTVSISPGNSGGPLVNKKGELVGINNAGMIHVAASNIGYAVPIELYKLTAKRLFHVPVNPSEPGPHRVLRPPGFGLFIQPTTKQQTASTPCCPQGMYIFQVIPGSPASQAGIQPGDLLCELEHSQVDNTGEVQTPWSVQKVPVVTAVLRLNDPTQAYHFKIWSSATQQCTHHQLTPLVLDTHGSKMLYFPHDPVDYLNVQGFILMNMSKNHLGFDDLMITMLSLEPLEWFQPHVFITHIVPGSPAAMSKTLTVGDTVVAVNRKQVNSIADVKRRLQSKPGGPHQLTTQTGKTVVL